MSVDISGAIDLHCHYGPDAHRERSVTAIEAATQARDAGHAGVLLKSHNEPTAQLARVVEEAVDGIDVFGGVCCDHEIGGLNPAAVEVALALGGRVVWLPTLSSRQDVANGVAAQLGIPGPGLAVLDDDGELLPEVREIARSLSGARRGARHRAHDGGGAPRGGPGVRSAAEGAGHPRDGGARGPEPQRRRASSSSPISARRSSCARSRASVRSRPGRSPTSRARPDQVGVERCTLASDYGQAVNDPPAEGLQRFADSLAVEGPADDIRTMVVSNPALLVTR